MIDKSEIISFFDRCAENWDAEMIRDEDVIASIIDNAGVREGIRVLDVACGTGVLFDDYLKRGVSSVTGIDISPEMVKRARAKSYDPRVSVICGDIEEINIADTYDVVMVYNAFPHFPDPGKLIKKLADVTGPVGRLSIAHGMSRAKIDAHHSGSARHVSNELLTVEALSDIMSEHFAVDILISDDNMYQVAGKKRPSTVCSYR